MQYPNIRFYNLTGSCPSSAYGDKTAAILYSLIGSCRVNGINSYESLKDVLTRINTLPLSMRWRDWLL